MEEKERKQCSYLSLSSFNWIKCGTNHICSNECKLSFCTQLQMSKFMFVHIFNFDTREIFIREVRGFLTLRVMNTRIVLRNISEVSPSLSRQNSWNSWKVLFIDMFIFRSQFIEIFKPIRQKIYIDKIDIWKYLCPLKVLHISFLRRRQTNRGSQC